MDDHHQLPEGYTPIEYIEYHPKQEQLYAFGQFEKYKEALELAKRIDSSCGKNVCNISCFQVPENVLFGVVFPESVFEIVNFLKKDDCLKYELPTNVIYNIPILYRFIEEQYVDEFFKTGKLKLTTFDNCKKLEDDNRKDTKEGQSELFGYDGDVKMKIGFGVGSDVIMLCSSLCSEYKDDKGTIYTKYIEIFDVQGLLFTIAEQLSKNGYTIKSMMYGPCFYTKKEFHGAVHSDAFREKLDKEQKFDWDEMMRIANTIGGNNMFFQKPVDKRSENEFRLLWIVDNLEKDKDIFVTIQHPETYCKLIDNNKKR